jgi:hypothetical protein
MKFSWSSYDRVKVRRQLCKIMKLHVFNTQGLESSFSSKEGDRTPRPGGRPPT